MLDVQVLDDASVATAALHPMRSRLLAELATPASAAALAKQLGVPRQKITYHLRELEKHGLVREAETRKWGGLTERLYAASASNYAVGSDALGSLAAEPNGVRDRLSAAYLVALAARAVTEVGRLISRARQTRKRLATLSIDTDLRFASASARAAFTRELTDAVGALSRKYHSDHGSGGRWHRLIIASYPGAPPLQQRNDEENAR